MKSAPKVEAKKALNVLQTKLITWRSADVANSFRNVATEKNIFSWWRQFQSENIFPFDNFSLFGIFPLFRRCQNHNHIAQHVWHISFPFLSCRWWVDVISFGFELREKLANKISVNVSKLTDLFRPRPPPVFVELPLNGSPMSRLMHETQSNVRKSSLKSYEIQLKTSKSSFMTFTRKPSSIPKLLLVAASHCSRLSLFANC